MIHRLLDIMSGSYSTNWTASVRPAFERPERSQASHRAILGAVQFINRRRRAPRRLEIFLLSDGRKIGRSAHWVTSEGKERR